MGVVVIGNDFTALNVALPAIENDFDVDVGTVQWVVNAYALMFGMAIVTGGRLADMYGRRRIFFIGAAIFAVFSLGGGLAPDSGTLIAMRVAMVIGFALLEPRVGERALVPRDVFRNGGSRATCIAVVLFSATFLAIILYIP